MHYRRNSHALWQLGLATAAAVSAAAQQPDSVARADSIARARRDSITLAREVERIRNEPRARVSDPIPIAPPLRLTRREAIQEALARNPTITVAREQVSQAEARYVQAAALPEPGIGATVLGQSGFIRPHSASETDISFGITVPFPQKIYLRGAAARGDVGNAQQTLALQRQTIAFQTSQAYDSLLVSERHRTDFLESQLLAADFLKKTEARYNAGTAAKLDVIQARVGVAQAGNDVLGAERGVATARAALNRLLGRVLGATIEPADSLAIPAPPPELDALERAALTNRPEIRGVAAQQQGAKANRSLAQQFWLPDVSLSVSRNNVYGEAPNYSSGIGIGIPLFFWQHTRGEVAEAKHHEYELAASYRDVTSQVGQDIRSTYAVAVTALRQVIFIRDELLPAATEAYRVASVSYGLGGSSAIEVLTAQQTLIAARSQYATAL
ncbi:MAG: TolC family protein, partial [Gemmatimonadota bacterium]|nr:TolC family protein [Gemmatimonadota bacterium]